MKDVVETILRHPFAVLMIIGGTCVGVSDVIRAIKGTTSKM